MIFKKNLLVNIYILLKNYKYKKTFFKINKFIKIKNKIV